MQRHAHALGSGAELHHHILDVAHAGDEDQDGALAPVATRLSGREGSQRGGELQLLTDRPYWHDARPGRALRECLREVVLLLPYRPKQSSRPCCDMSTRRRGGDLRCDLRRDLRRELPKIEH